MPHRAADCHCSPVSFLFAKRSVTFPFLGREIPSLFILEMRLVLGNPSLAAAPSGPPIIQPVLSSVPKIRDRVQSLNVPTVGLRLVFIRSDTGVLTNDGGIGLESTPSFDRMTARSIRFWSSRTFPGQE